MTSVTALGHARGEIIAFEDYLEHVLGNVVPLAPVEVGLAQAAGLVTSEPARALAPAPAFTNSAMDGFALNTADLPGSGKVRLPVSGDIPAGGKGTWTAGAAVRIMTGAPVPAGANTVIPVEFTDHPTTRAPAPKTVEVPGDWPADQNIRRAGSDIAGGEEILPANTTLSGAALAGLAGVGVQRVRVWPKVRVGVIVTGDEVVTHNPGPSQVLDSNSLLITPAVTDFGGVVTRVRISSDDPLEFAAAFDDVAPHVDLLLTTGGASVGAHDVARHVLSGRGVEFVSVGIQPAKPQGFGVVDGVAVAALPGNPGAVHVSLHAIVRPILAHMGRVMVPAPEFKMVREGWKAREGMRQFVPVRIDAGEIAPVIPGGVASHRVRSLAYADGLASVDPGVSSVEAGDVLPVIVTNPAASPHRQ
ncbi:MAG TPA: gephyrin-like molybdotransferase Glp [Beutenbergiaceae bacterium]|nr:gephyrin-like molybdotransferase Glp [Beutenbergiaceae bacterium]